MPLRRQCSGSEQPRIVQSLHKARKGARAAYEASRASGDPRMTRATAYAKTLLLALRAKVENMVLEYLTLYPP